MSEPDEWRIAWSDAVKTPSSVVAHADDRFTFERHLLDWMRTRIKPGADPRSKWSGSLTKTDPTIYRDEPHTPKWCEVGPSDRPDLAWINGPWNALGWRLSSRARYVPLDVCRWRDPEHREALKRRARAHAALVPGNRATMGVER
jgi:hypothetical protein